MSWVAGVSGSRLVRLGGLIVCIALVMLLWRPVSDQGDVVSRREVPGVIAKVFPHAYLVDVDGGPRVRVLSTIKADQGTRVRLQVTSFSSGGERYALLGLAAKRE